MVDQLNQDAIDKKKIDEEERKKAQEAHDEFKESKRIILLNVKDELDTILSNPNMIA